MRHKKKIAVLLFAVLQLLEAIPAFGYGEPLLKNGDFSELEGWQGYQTTLVCDDNEYHTAAPSLRLEKAADQTVGLSQLFAVEAGASYRVRLWMCPSYNRAEKGVVFEYNFYTGTNARPVNIGSTCSSDYFQYEDEGKWTEKTAAFTAPPGASFAKLTIYLYAKGSVLLDDISVEKIKEPSRMLLETDAVFYYSDKATGKVTARQNQASYSDFSNLQVTYGLYDGEVCVQGPITKPFSDGTSWDFSLAGLIKGKKYIVRLSLSDAGGNILETAEESVYVYDRPTYLKKDGRFVKNGKEIHPVIGYTPGWPAKLTDEVGMAELKANMRAAKSLGINVIMSNTSVKLDEMQVMLDTAKGEGLYVILALYKNMLPAGHPRRASVTANAVTEFMGHEALFAYAMLDEPFAGKTVEDGKAWLENGYKIIRDIDPNHPVYLCECPEYMQNAAQPVSWRYPLAAKYADCLAIDPYPAGVYSDTEFVYDQVMEAREAVKNEKPVYAILQAFTWKNNTPSEAALKNGIYQAYFAGANGSGYYRISNPLGDGVTLSETKYGTMLTDFHEEERAILDAAFLEGTYPTLRRGETSTYRYAFFEENENIYMVLAAKTEAETRCSLSLPKDGGYKAVRVSVPQAETIPYTEETISVTLSGMESVIYRLEPTMRPEYIPNGNFDEDMTGWSLSSDTFASALTWDATGGEDGAGALKVNLSGAESTDITRNAAFVFSGNILEPGKTYRLTFRMKSTKTGIKPCVYFRNQWMVDGQLQNGQVLDAQGNGADNSFAASVTTGWETYTYCFNTVPPAEGATLVKSELKLKVNKSDFSAVLWYDNVSLTEDYSECTFADEMRNSLSQMPKDEAVTAKYHVVNPGEAEKDYVVYFAVYEEGEAGRELVGFEATPAVVGAQGFQDIVRTFGPYRKPYIVKALLWAYGHPKSIEDAVVLGTEQK